MEFHNEQDDLLGLIFDDELSYFSDEELQSLMAKNKRDNTYQKWKKLSDFILHEDEKVFRFALSSINRELYARWKKVANFLHKKENQGKSRTDQNELDDVPSTELKKISNTKEFMKEQILNEKLPFPFDTKGKIELAKILLKKTILKKIFSKRKDVSIPRKLVKHITPSKNSYWNKIRYSKLFEFLRNHGDKAIKNSTKKVKNNNSKLLFHNNENFEHSLPKIKYFPLLTLKESRLQKSTSSIRSSLKSEHFKTNRDSNDENCKTARHTLTGNSNCMNCDILIDSVDSNETTKRTRSLSTFWVNKPSNVLNSFNSLNTKSKFKIDTQINNEDLFEENFKLKEETDESFTNSSDDSVSQ